MQEYQVNKFDIIHETSVDFVLRPCSREVNIVQYDDNLSLLKVHLYRDSEPFKLDVSDLSNITFDLVYAKPDRPQIGIFNAQRVYHKGEYCLHPTDQENPFTNKIYKCVVDTSTRGSFVDNEWAVETITEALYYDLDENNKISTIYFPITGDMSDRSGYCKGIVRMTYTNQGASKVAQSSPLLFKVLKQY